MALGTDLFTQTTKDRLVRSIVLSRARIDAIGKDEKVDVQKWLPFEHFVDFLQHRVEMSLDRPGTELDGVDTRQMGLLRAVHGWTQWDQRWLSQSVVERTENDLIEWTGVGADLFQELFDRFFRLQNSRQGGFLVDGHCPKEIGGHG